MVRAVRIAPFNMPSPREEALSYYMHQAPEVLNNPNYDNGFYTDGFDLNYNGQVTMDELRAYDNAHPQSRGLRVGPGPTPMIDRRALNAIDTELADGGGYGAFDNFFGPPSNSGRSISLSRAPAMPSSGTRPQQIPGATPLPPNDLPASMRNVSLSTADFTRIAKTIAGEISNQLSPYGTDLNRQEIANIMETIATRAALSGKSLADVTRSSSQYSTWNDEGKIATANANYEKFKSYIDSAVNDYMNGTLQPTHKGLTNYYNADIASPSWAKKMQVATKVGPHTFLVDKKELGALSPKAQQKENVKAIQEALNLNGFAGRDGKAIEVTGKLDKDTMHAMDAAREMQVQAAHLGMTPQEFAIAAKPTKPQSVNEALIAAAAAQRKEIAATAARNPNPVVGKALQVQTQQTARQAIEAAAAAQRAEISGRLNPAQKADLSGFDARVTSNMRPTNIGANKALNFAPQTITGTSAIAEQMAEQQATSAANKNLRMARVDNLFNDVNASAHVAKEVPAFSIDDSAKSRLSEALALGGMTSAKGQPDGGIWADGYDDERFNAERVADLGRGATAQGNVGKTPSALQAGRLNLLQPEDRVKLAFDGAVPRDFSPNAAGLFDVASSMADLGRFSAEGYTGRDVPVHAGARSGLNLLSPDERMGMTFDGSVMSDFSPGAFAQRPISTAPAQVDLAGKAAQSRSQNMMTSLTAPNNVRDIAFGSAFQDLNRSAPLTAPFMENPRTVQTSRIGADGRVISPSIVMSPNRLDLTKDDDAGPSPNRIATTAPGYSSPYDAGVNLSPDQRLAGWNLDKDLNLNSALPNNPPSSSMIAGGGNFAPAPDALMTGTSTHPGKMADDYVGPAKAAPARQAPAAPRVSVSSYNPAVEQLQRTLNSLGFRGADGRILLEDGILGDNTKAAHAAAITAQQKAQQVFRTQPVATPQVAQRAAAATQARSGAAGGGYVGAGYSGSANRGGPAYAGERTTSGGGSR